MAIFVTRDKYFNFTENTHPQNTVNKLSYEVASITEDNTETIFKTSSKHSPTYTTNTTENGRSFHQNCFSFRICYRQH